MALKLKEIVDRETDILIIGGGGAGLRAAIAAREKGTEALLVSKSPAGYGNNTAIAGGGFASAGGWRDPRDNLGVHSADTLRSGRFLNNQSLVDVVVRGGIQLASELERYGVNFVKMEGGPYRVGLVPGHSYPRNLTCIEHKGTGFSVPLRRHALELGVKLLEGLIVTRLLKSGNAITGAMAIDEEGRAYYLRAKATVLATGGLGQIYLRTNNALEATGDGYALAYEAGAPLQDMEFIQFYPTCVGRRDTMALAMYEHIVFSGGAVIRNSLRQDILELYGIKDQMKITRDMLAQAIMQEIKAGRSHDGFVSLDLTTIPEPLRQKYRTALPKGMSLEQERLMVSPGVHYTMGGVQIDRQAKTSVVGLYAAGEVCGGIQGANRLGGNALTDVFVFGAIAGEVAAKRAREIAAPARDDNAVREEIDRLQGWADTDSGEKPAELISSLKKTMWERVGVIRDGPGLQKALSEIGSLRLSLNSVSVSDHKEWLQAIRLGKMLTVAEMVTRSALLRQESRGAHYRSDYPEEKNQDWLCNILVRRERSGMGVSRIPVSPLPDQAVFS